MLHHLGLSHFTFTKKPHKGCSKFFNLGSLYKKPPNKESTRKGEVVCDGHETLGNLRSCNPALWTVKGLVRFHRCLFLVMVDSQNRSVLHVARTTNLVMGLVLETFFDVMHFGRFSIDEPSTCQTIICTANNCENYIMLGFLFPLHRIPSILRWVSCSTCCLQSKTVSGPWFLVGESQRSAFAHGQGGQGVNVTEENRGFKQHMKLCRSI